MEAPVSIARPPKNAAAAALVALAEWPPPPVAAVACRVSARGGLTGNVDPPADEEDEGDDVFAEAAAWAIDDGAAAALELDASSDCQSLIFLLSNRLL